MAAPQSVRDESGTAQADTRSGEPAGGIPGGGPGPRDCSAGRHRLFVVGYLRGPRPAWLDCDRPLQVMCRDCDHETRWACSGHRESRCKPCSGRYRRRVARVAASGTSRADGWLYLLTLTAPGDREHRMPSGDVCPCTPRGGVDLARWNASHSSRWNRFRTALRRDEPDLEFFRGVEVQGRGALHDHALMWSPHSLTKRRLKELALAAGFGHSVDLAPVTSAKQVTYYVSKYVTKATDSRSSVPWWGVADVDESTGEITEGDVDGRYRTWSKSQRWGLTMADVRREALDWVRAREAQLAADGMLTLLMAFGDAEWSVAPEIPPLSSA